MAMVEAKCSTLCLARMFFCSSWFPKFWFHSIWLFKLTLSSDLLLDNIVSFFFYLMLYFTPTWNGSFYLRMDGMDGISKFFVKNQPLAYNQPIRM